MTPFCKSLSALTDIQYPQAEQPVTFEAPPVNEVAFAVQFEAPVIDLEVLGALASRVKGEFPEREQHPSLAPMGEEFGLIARGPQVVFRTEPDLPRTWFVSADGATLIQAQADRFAFNWRRVRPDQEYPRYNGLRERLIVFLSAVMDLISATHSRTAGINACELTYVNELAAPEVEPRNTHPSLSQFLRIVNPMAGDFLPAAEDARLQARWRIPTHEEPRGRLYASADPAIRPDGAPVFLLTMTARMLASAADVAVAVALLDEAHTWVVNGFKDLTTEEMHKVWRLKEET